MAFGRLCEVIRGLKRGIRVEVIEKFVRPNFQKFLQISLPTLPVSSPLLPLLSWTSSLWVPNSKIIPKIFVGLI